MPEIVGVTFAQMDFLDNDAPDRLKAMMGGLADVVMSDHGGQAPPATARPISSASSASSRTRQLFAADVLKPGGTFVAKVFQSGADATLMTQLKRDFATVNHVQPAASRKDSSERYVLAMGFRGVAGDHRLGEHDN